MNFHMIQWTSVHCAVGIIKEKEKEKEGFHTLHGKEVHQKENQKVKTKERLERTTKEIQKERKEERAKARVKDTAGKEKVKENVQKEHFSNHTHQAISGVQSLNIHLQER